VEGAADDHDPFLRHLLEYWEEIWDLADEAQQSEMTAAIAEGVARNVALPILQDVVLDMLEAGLLAPDHPLAQHIGSGTLLASHTEVDAADAAGDLAALRSVWLRNRLIPRPTPSSQPGPPRRSTDEGLVARVKAALLELPARSPDEIAAPDDAPLIRLAPSSGGEIRLPEFQFDRSGRPHDVVMEVNSLIDAVGDPWAVACWWVYPHAAFGSPPAQLIGVDETLLRRAARSLVED
jgi:hypothetical protein